MNKKAFTLIELLGVIIILSLLVLITTNVVTNILKNSKHELSDYQIQIIKSSAESWGSENISKLPNALECKYITLGYLKDEGIIDDDILDLNNNQKVSDDLVIKITSVVTSSGLSYFTYEVNSNDISGCVQITE